MFDIGFTELLVIATITLLVLGPERMPEAVRTVSLWIGRFKRSLRETRREIEQQIGADDIRRELHNEEIMRNLEKFHSDVNRTLDEDVALESELYPTSGKSEKESSKQDAAHEDSTPAEASPPEARESPSEHSSGPEKPKAEDHKP